jgi:Protein of unknown function (DUF2911)
LYNSAGVKSSKGMQEKISIEMTADLNEIRMESGITCTFANKFRNGLFYRCIELNFNIQLYIFSKMIRKIYLSLFAFFALLTAATAQLKTPQPSPTGKVTQEVGLSKVEIEYSRPSAKGRVIFGDLVRFGEKWRTGANGSTKIMFDDDAKVNNGAITLPKGTYALYTIPGEKEWSIIFYKNTSFGGVPGPKDWKVEDVAAEYKVPSKMIAEKVETFTIGVSNLRSTGADIDLVWENTKVSIPFTYDTDAKVMADIKTQLDGPSAGTYYAAGRYYFEEKKDMKLALEWVNKALEKGGDKFWMLRMKATILAEMGRYKDAIEVAEASTVLAKKEGNADYPNMNDKSIADWKKKM